MTVHSGGPHILLFERDQQLTALLNSEFQLAGYECHAARTAVEVFDAIARYPIRLVLVDLAQAAAGRREFWVALDAQRRGRGVQVFTFRCMNIAGYGPDDPDERARAVLTDMEVDGMLGVMNLVDAVRSRIPGSTTGSFPRVQVPTPSQDSAKYQAVRPASQPASQPALQSLQSLSAQPVQQSINQPTAPIPMTASQAGVQAVAASTQQATVANMPSAQEQASVARPSTFTDKIRAVIYPSNRGSAPAPEASRASQTPSGPLPATRAFNEGMTDSRYLNANVTQATPSRPSGAPSEESGLAQLSRMVQDTATPPHQPQVEVASQPQARMTTPPATPTIAQPERETMQTMPTMPAPAAVIPPISDLTLRASPIEDLPDERTVERRNGTFTPISSGNQAQARTEQENATPTSPLVAVRPAPELAEASSVKPEEQEHIQPEETVQSVTDEPSQLQEEVSERDRLIDEVLVPQQEQSSQKVMDILQSPALRKRSELSMTSEDVLLDIVQSLPPMNALPTPTTSMTPISQQSSVLNGRATRSLANVLLEGHLVAENRLDAAQSIQRMLRGVDMNYQLGEILLMFKLLTPDQLLAASLVSYGLISAPQISALGRIRQELHSLGLEYDLESLLVLFRMLTPDQLREVRASWTA